MVQWNMGAIELDDELPTSPAGAISLTISAGYAIDAIVCSLA